MDCGRRVNLGEFAKVDLRKPPGQPRQNAGWLAPASWRRFPPSPAVFFPHPRRPRWLQTTVLGCLLTPPTRTRANCFVLAASGPGVGQHRRWTTTPRGSNIEYGRGVWRSRLRESHSRAILSSYDKSNEPEAVEPPAGAQKTFLCSDMLLTSTGLHSG